MGKRYYWLKMPANFFNDKQIKKLRRIAGGDTYTVIYLKMLLRSMQTGGELYFDGIEDTIADEIALEIDEDTENVAVTLQFLEKTGLVEIHEESILLTSLPAMVGSEGTGAERVRNYRDRQKTLQCNTDALRSNEGVTEVKRLCNVEKRREDKSREEDIREDKKRVDKTYFDYPDLNTAFIDFVEMRKKINAPMTDKEVDQVISKLEELTNGNVSMMVRILEQSTRKGLRGVFPCLT